MRSMGWSTSTMCLLRTSKRSRYSSIVSTSKPAFSARLETVSVIALPLVHENAVLVRPVHPPLEVGATREAFQHEERAQELLLHERDVRRIHLELRRHVEQSARVGME